jgi:hypothetical protein
VGVYVVLHGWGSFWTTTLLSRHDLELGRFHQLVAHYVTVPYRLLLALAFAPCVFYVALRADGAVRKLFIAWLAVGLTEAMPSLVSYFKHAGYWNNLVVVDLWASLLVFGVLLHAVREARARGAIVARAAFGGGLATLLVTLVPTRIPPTHGQYVFGRALDEAIARDVASGKRILLSEGVSSLVHNGLLAVPLDRAASAIELSHGGGDSSELDAMKERLALRSYDKIYVLDGYPAAIQRVIDANYHEVGVIPADPEPHRDDDLFAYQAQYDRARILEANEPIRPR